MSRPGCVISTWSWRTDAPLDRKITGPLAVTVTGTVLYAGGLGTFAIAGGCEKYPPHKLARCPGSGPFSQPSACAIVFIPKTEAQGSSVIVNNMITRRLRDDFFTETCQLFSK